MKTIIAKNAGFCFGVKRAIDIAFDVADTKSNVLTLGPLIHNEQVVNKLREHGVNPIKALDEAADGSTVIIRTHGVGADVLCGMNDKNIEIIDATCPYVKKIHNIVNHHHKNGYQIVIIGDKSHPEVVGINGWCQNSAIVISTPEEILGIINKKSLCFVVQTTFSLEIWTKIKNIAKNSCKDAVIFDTICSATEKRQSEAEIISSKAEAMLVIGGRSSSNTKKLVDICTANCADTYHIETFLDIPKSIYQKSIAGVTAGASTPEWIIKEVIEKMSEEKVNVGTEETNVSNVVETATGEFSFADELDKSMKTLKSGDIVNGTVIGISPAEVWVNLGAKMDGYIPAGELCGDPNASPYDIVKIGEEITVFVVRVSDVEGTIMLSKKKIESIKGRKTVEAALETGEVLSGKVVEAVNGGIIVLSNGVRIFVPASQASAQYVKELDTLVGTDVSFRVIDINQRRGKIVGSVKTVASEVRKQAYDAFWATAEIGKQYDGVVKSLTDFGAFVDIGGIDGLVHISELSWGRIKHPSEVISVGDEVKVTVVALDKEKNKISLGYRSQSENPWELVKTKITVGDVITVKIVRIVTFGAFAEIIPHVDGLIHISQISNTRIDKVSSVLSIGQEVEVKVTETDYDNKKISLSIRALIEPEEIVTEEDPVEFVGEILEATVLVDAPVVEEVVEVAGESVEAAEEVAEEASEKTAESE